MYDFPKMFCVFVTKQTSKFCGTNRQLSRIDSSIANICPSCGQLDESTKHITRCRDEGCTAMWTTCVTSLVNWMASTTGDLTLCNMVEAYLSGRGDIPMVDCVTSR